MFERTTRRSFTGSTAYRNNITFRYSQGWIEDLWKQHANHVVARYSNAGFAAYPCCIILGFLNLRGAFLTSCLTPGQGIFRPPPLTQLSVFRPAKSSKHTCDATTVAALASTILPTEPVSRSTQELLHGTHSLWS